MSQKEVSRWSEHTFGVDDFLDVNIGGAFGRGAVSGDFPGQTKVTIRAVVIVVMQCLKNKIKNGINTQARIIVFGRYPQMILLNIGKHRSGILVAIVPRKLEIQRTTLQLAPQPILELI